jgi:hypothetical protein
MFTSGQKVVRKNDEDKNKKWPDQWANTPLKVLEVSGDRIRFSAYDYPELVNHRGWVASRFILASIPEFNPLSRFL